VVDGRRVVLRIRAARDSLDEILAFIALDAPAVASNVAEVVRAMRGDGLARRRYAPRARQPHAERDWVATCGLTPIG
jgi:hypothetical protein